MLVGTGSKKYLPCKAMVPNIFLAAGTGFMEDKFSMNWGGRGGFRMFQAHYFYCALYLSYYYINPTSDHQALDSGGWGPLL